MLIKFLKNIRIGEEREVGEVIEVSDNVGKVLIEKGIAEETKKEKRGRKKMPKIETKEKE